MKTIHSLSSTRKIRGPVILAAGFFDGMHIGHQKLIKKAVEEAEKSGGSAWVMTFNTHPMKVLSPDKAPRLLTCTTHKLSLIRTLEVNGCIIAPFTTDLAQQSPEAFITMLKKNIPELRLLFVGQNWTFGRNAEGNAKILKKMTREHDFEARIIPSVCRKGKPISSTRIRRAIERGELDEAARMLGRPVSIWGTTIEGNKVGTEIGIPTANINPHNEVYPPDGVYAGHAIMNGKNYSGVVNLGTRPTLKNHFSHIPEKNETKRVLELHIFDMSRNLYGKQIEVFFDKKLRNERRFKDVLALKRQIQKDITAARQLMKTNRKDDR